MTPDSHTARERIDVYLAALRVRIRALIYTRAAAAVTAAALAITCSGVILLSRNQFSASIVISMRLVLLAAVIAVVVWLLCLPLRRLGAANGAHEFERRLPTQRGRIQTYLDMQRREARGERTAFAELLAEDAARIADTTPVESVIVTKQVWIPALLACVASSVLVGMLIVGPAQWGYGSRHLLLGMQLPRAVVPQRLIIVEPGNTTVRRNGDLSIVATMQGFVPDNAALYVRFDDERGWQRAPMQSQMQRNGNEAWVFQLYALRGPLHYYVTADTARSAEHTVAVADLPRIDKVRLTYSYPQWTGLKPVTDDEQRSIRAVAATQVKIEVFADAPLQAPALIVNGSAAQIEAAGNTATGNLIVDQAGSYFIGAKVLNDFVPLTEDYQIEIVNDEPPSIEILKPGRDWRATNIEEVPVRVQARDDFRLQNVELRYAVNGGQWQKVSLDAGAAEVDNEPMLRLEELGAAQPAVDATLPGQLAPGDLVSYYAVAKDRSKQVQTDLFMVQVQPFERRFTQNSAGGGGGGGEDEQGAISERQKEILLATWNLQRSDQRTAGSAPRTRQQLQENAAMLSELQTTLAQQALTVAQRTRARVSLDQDPRVKAFVESMESAAKVMMPAAEHLKSFQLDQAVPIEQQALQQLLRAESAFRDVQVSMQRESSSSGGGAEAARNFSEMFELEMDLQKNQYETQSQLSQQSRQQELDEAIRKLKELAERQEKLAQQAQRHALPEQQQRWRQEQLRREAEDLKRRLAELSREQPGSDTQGRRSSERAEGQSSAGTSEQANGKSRPQPGSNAERERLAKTLQSLTKALDEMRAANAKNESGSPQDQSSHRQAANDAASSDTRSGAAPGEWSGPQQSANDPTEESAQSAAQASRNLRQALQQIARPPEPGLGEKVERLADRAAQLTQTQREISATLQQALSESMQANRRRGAIDPRRARSLAEDKQGLSRELAQLQSEMRNTAHQHRGDAPAASTQLIATLSELEASNVSARIERSADEVQYGRAREAAAREGLIDEALQSLEQGLRASAALAAQGRDKSEEATPEELLARIGQLRQSLQQAQTGLADEGEGRIASSRQSGQSSQSQPQAQPSEAGNGLNRDGSARGTAPNGLAAWNPVTPRSSSELRASAGRFRETAELSEQVRTLAKNMQGRGLNNAEMAALRRLTQDLRRLAGDPMAQMTDMTQLIDRIELAALAVAERTKDGVSSRTTVRNAETAEYREAVAEYYRRLGATRPGSSR